MFRVLVGNNCCNSSRTLFTSRYSQMPAAGQVSRMHHETQFFWKLFWEERNWASIKLNNSLQAKELPEEQKKNAFISFYCLINPTGILQYRSEMYLWYIGSISIFSIANRMPIYPIYTTMLPRLTSIILNSRKQVFFFFFKQMCLVQLSKRDVLFKLNFMKKFIICVYVG